MSEAHRKLAAIMFTDIVGYTKMSQEDERGAMDLLQRHNGLIRPVLGRFHGREVKTIGDSFLVEFDSALDATECAGAIQRTISKFNTDESPSRPLHIRIGIHVGDVIHQGGDVFGDAVNLAARVQPLADPDGICISEQVFVQVRNKLPYRFVQLPPQNLKNVQFEMNLYKAVIPSAEDPGLNQATEPPSRTRVAVLPFTNISHDHADEYFADGITEELITAISQVHELKVIARTSTARYKGTPKSVAEIGKELNAGSVLEGSTRMAGNKVRVTAQLIDTLTEEHIWANNYDRQLDDIFTIQSEIAGSVSQALKVQLLSAERKELERRPTKSSSAFVKYLKGRAALHNRRQEDLRAAKKHFESALAEDKGFAMAYVGLADANFLLAEYFAMPRAEGYRESRGCLDKALALDPKLPEAHVALANALQHDYRFHEARKEYEIALSTNPNYAQGHHWYSICLWDMARDDQAFEEMAKAEELDPMSVVIASNMAYAYCLKGDRAKAEESVSKIRELDPKSDYADLALSYISEFDSDYKAAVAHLERTREIDPTDLTSLARLGKLHGLLGDTAKAREILSRLKEEPHHDQYQLAVVYGGLGERDEMFTLMERAFEERSLIFRGLWKDAVEFGVTDDSRYKPFLSRAGLG